MEERLITYSVSIINLTTHIKKNKAGIHLSDQLVRSGTSVALNYAESIDAESRRDYLHKTKISLKELRETYTCLKIIQKADLIYNPDAITKILSETDELVSIFVSKVKKLKQNPEQGNSQNL